MLRRFLESLLNFWYDHFGMISTTEIIKIGVVSFLVALYLGVSGGGLTRISVYWAGIFFLWLIILKTRRR